MVEFAGVVSEDEPDPASAQSERARELPVPVLRLVAQPNLDAVDSVGISSSDGVNGRSAMAVTLSYLLWRNPADRSDPANLADLDEQTRRALDTVPPWPRPAWLIEGAERMRYPSLWEAVRTTWLRDTSPRRTLATEMVAHTEYILMNRYRPAGEAGILPGERPRPIVSAKAVDASVSVSINGVQIPGAQIDTDPFVYSIGAQLSDNSFLTAVLPRDELDYVQIEFDTRPHPARSDHD